MTNSRFDGENVTDECEWLRQIGNLADHGMDARNDIVCLDRVRQTIHSEIGRRRDIRFAGAITAVLLLVSIFVWRTERLNLEMTHSSWPGYSRHVMFKSEY